MMKNILRLASIVILNIMFFNTYAHANVRYSIFISEFTQLGGSKEGVKILEDMAKEANTEKERQRYKTNLEKFIGENNVDIKCPYCYLEALDNKLVELVKADTFDEKLYNKILKEANKHRYNLAKVYINAFAKMNKEDRIVASKVMDMIFNSENMADKFKALQKKQQGKHNSGKPIEPRAE